MHSLIVNYYLKVSIDGPSRPHLVSNFLLQVSILEIHNIMVIPLEEGGLKYKRDVENNTIISDYTLQSVMPSQLKNMYANYKVMCGCECCISAKIINS